MAKSINKVELLGRLGADPEMKYTASGTAVTQLRLATDRVRKLDFTQKLGEVKKTG